MGVGVGKGVAVARRTVGVGLGTYGVLVGRFRLAGIGVEPGSTGITSPEGLGVACSAGERCILVVVVVEVSVARRMVAVAVGVGVQVARRTVAVAVRLGGKGYVCCGGLGVSDGCIRFIVGLAVAVGVRVARRTVAVAAGVTGVARFGRVSVALGLSAWLPVSICPGWVGVGLAVVLSEIAGNARVGEADGRSVRVGSGMVGLGVALGMRVGGIGVGVKGFVGVRVGGWLGVTVGVADGRRVAVAVPVAVGVRVRVGVRVGVQVMKRGRGVRVGAWRGTLRVSVATVVLGMVEAARVVWALTSVYAVLVKAGGNGVSESKASGGASSEGGIVAIMGAGVRNELDSACRLGSIVQPDNSRTNTTGRRLMRLDFTPVRIELSNLSITPGL